MPSRVCPQCRSEVAWEGNSHRPFCSERCRLIDLGAWLGDRYAIAGEPAESEVVDDAMDDGGSPAAAPAQRKQGTGGARAPRSTSNRGRT